MSEVHIKWPEQDVVTVSAETGLAYIMRKDGNFTMKPVAEKIVGTDQADLIEIQRILAERYDIFTAQLVDIMGVTFGSLGDIEVHLYDPDALEEKALQKLGDCCAVSMDPLLTNGHAELAVSRAYFLGGVNAIGQTHRPGFPSVEEQIGTIQTQLTTQETYLIEDDVFEGGTVRTAVASLQAREVKIKKVIPGIQVGDPTIEGVEFDPVVLYRDPEGGVPSNVDLGDPRDFLVGASGLVVQLPTGEFGRCPYILPFVSPHARASIPLEQEVSFSREILGANLVFYSNVEDQIGKPVLLDHMHEDFFMFMHTVYGFDKSTSMTHIINWALDSLDELWPETLSLSEQQAAIASLDLPKKMVLVDVNGTLISDDTNSPISIDDRNKLQEQIKRLEQNGVYVGLCSDSPLPQLQQMATELGMQGPILAENGNIIANGENEMVARKLENIEQIRNQIIAQANQLTLQHGADVIAPEFGGAQDVDYSTTWAFGANRETSVAVFGPSKLITELGQAFGNRPGISCDVSPEFNYFAIHPGQNYRSNKAETLQLLDQYGYNTLMIGNSVADWSQPENGLATAFVANAIMPATMSSRASYISLRNNIHGVIDILSHVNT